MSFGASLRIFLTIARLGAKFARYLPNRPRYEVPESQGGLSLIILDRGG